MNPELAADPSHLTVPLECIPDTESLITEDGKPVDRILTEKQYRLLTEPLYSSWTCPSKDGRFEVFANVGLFSVYKHPPVVPDVMLSLGVRVGEDLHYKDNRSYFMWVLGKPPDVVIEIVSDHRGGEDSTKMEEYARIGVWYYAIYDPDEILGNAVLRVYVLRESGYEPIDGSWLPKVGLGLKLWEGPFEDTTSTWLRWCDRHGQVIPTGRERAEEGKAIVEREQARAEQEKARAEQEKARAEQLAAKLRALGVDPNA